MDEKVISNVSDLTPIADALRSTTGSTQTYSVPELTVAAVNAIIAGGGSSVIIDTTLTQSGQAADAQAVGDALETKADVGHTHTAAEIGADVSGAADSALTSAKSYTDTQIAAIDYPVDSVNGKTGAVVLSASDVGALPSTTVIPDALADLTADSTHRTVTDAEKATWNAKSDFSGSYNDLTNKPTIPSIAGLATETYVDTAVSNLVESAPDTLNTLNELAAALGDDPNFATTVANQIGTKANSSDLASHTSNKSNPHSVTLSQLGVTATAAELNIMDGVTATTAELNYVDGVTSNIQTQLNAKVDVVSGKGLSTNDYTTAEKNKLAGIATGANAYTHPTYTSKTSGLYKVTVDGTGHVSGATAVAKSDITALGIPAQDTTYSAATTSAAGLMSAADKTKLNGIATGATKITVDSALSSTSTNPVQNKVVNAAISNLQTQVDDIEISIPVKGVHYFTPADQESIVQQVIAALGTPVFGTVDADNNIILSGELANGTYTVKYEDAEGNTVDIGSLNAVSGSFEITPTWNDGYSIETTMDVAAVGKVKAQTGYTVTDHITLEDGYAYTVSAKNWSGGSCYALWFNANGGLIASGQIANGDGWNTSATGNVSFTINPPVGTATFKLQSYCNGNYSVLSNVVVEATLDSTKKYGGLLITWQQGVKLNKSDGTVESTGHGSYSASDYIQLDKTKTYTLHLAIASGTNMSCGIVYYTASNGFVSCVVDVVHGQNNLFSHTLSIPSNATQMRLRPYDASGSHDWLDQLYITVSD